MRKNTPQADTAEQLDYTQPRFVSGTRVDEKRHLMDRMNELRATDEYYESPKAVYVVDFKSRKLIKKINLTTDLDNIKECLNIES